MTETLAYGGLDNWYEGRKLMAAYAEEAKQAGKPDFYGGKGNDTYVFRRGFG